MAQKSRKHYTPAMSYLQEAQLPAARVEVVARQVGVLPARVLLPLLLLLSFFHGALYAAFLPPWGLIDEAQHLHYIQYIAEEKELPVAGETYLSDEIIASHFATRRWETFHWTPPSSPDPQAMGLEGHSYEAYQPPLYYLLMAPIYLAVPGDLLVKLYALRGVALLLSLVTVWATYRCARLLLPRSPQAAFWAGLLLVAIPERAIATSRINNDVLLEVVAALFCLALTHALVKGLTTRHSLILGVLLGLGVWVKLSAGVLVVPLMLLFWLRRHDEAIARHFVAMASVVAPLGGALALRNLWLYGDLTGFGSFDQLHRLAAPDTSPVGIVRTLVTLPNHLWLVWWKGSEVGQNALLTLFYAIMAFVVLFAWVQLYRSLRRARVENPVLVGEPIYAFGEAETSGKEAVALSGDAEDVGGSTLRAAALIYAATVFFYALAVLTSYYEGMVPVIQGRFMLPAIVPFVLLLVWGPYNTRQGQWLLLAAVVLLWGMGMLSLFGNLVPYYYYWSGVLQGTLPLPSEVGLGELVALVYPRILFDKPALLAPLLPLLPVIYGLTLLVSLFVALRSLLHSPSTIASKL